MNNSETDRRAPRTVVKSADRALDVIEYITAAEHFPSFSEIARALDLPKSSLSQLLSNMVNRGYIDLDSETATYRPGTELLNLVSRAAMAIPLRSLVMPVLEKIRDEINETTGYYIRHGDEVELVGAAPSRTTLIYIMDNGERAPMYAISAGKVLLAHTNPDDFEEWLRRTSLKKFTAATTTSPKHLREELDRVRQEGFAYSHGEYSVGIEGIAYPVKVAGRVIGALNTSIPAVRYDKKVAESAKRALMIASTKLENILSARELSAARRK